LGSRCYLFGIGWQREPVFKSTEVTYLFTLEKGYKNKTTTEGKGDSTVLTLEKPLDMISEEDLKRLIENQVLEKKGLDYKLTLPSNSDGDKKEFLADVSSFANSGGGDIIYGISQDNRTGLPKELLGVDSPNIDQETLRLESMVRDGIEPRIPSIATHPVRLPNSKTAIILRIQKSWVAPHRINLKNDRRFYARSSNGKYELDVGELRNAFNLSESLNDKIKRFRENRIASIFANETPVPFQSCAKLVLHMIPLISFDPSVSFDVAKIQSSQYRPIGAQGWGHRYNLEGLVASSTSNEGLAEAYTQVYRNGIVEAVEGYMLKPYNDRKLVPSVAYEGELISSFTEYLSALKSLGVQMPVVVFLTFVNIKGYSMALSNSMESYMIDRDVLFLPEVLLNSYDVKAEQVLKPIFDAVWNSFGLPNSRNYNDKGEWKPKGGY
jgi:hypothetical protein